jgi:hypothetical protein
MPAPADSAVDSSLAVKHPYLRQTDDGPDSVVGSASVTRPTPGSSADVLATRMCQTGSDPDWQPQLGRLPVLQLRIVAVHPPD